MFSKNTTITAMMYLLHTHAHTTKADLSTTRSDATTPSSAKLHCYYP